MALLPSSPRPRRGPGGFYDGSKRRPPGPCRCSTSSLYIIAAVMLALNLVSFTGHGKGHRSPVSHNGSFRPRDDPNQEELRPVVLHERQDEVGSSRKDGVRNPMEARSKAPVQIRQKSMPSSSNGTLDCDVPAGESEVHVMYASDSHEYQALLASVTSALRNSAKPGLLRFHLVVPYAASKMDLCTKLVRTMEKLKKRWCFKEISPSYLPDPSSVPACLIMKKRGFHAPLGNTNIQGEESASCMCTSEQFHIVSFNAEQFKEQLSVVWAALKTYKPGPEGALRKELMNSINFARNFADDILLPYGVQRIVYLDADTIVQGDLVSLMGSLNFTDTHFFAAATSCKQRMEHWFDFKSHLVRQTMRRRDCYINAGVYAMDLSRYRQGGIQERIVQLVQADQRHKLWIQGIHQPSFILALYNHTIPLDSRWNTAGLGWVPDLDEKTLKNAKVLHWSGTHKPWQCDGYYASYWDPYAMDFKLKGCPSSIPVARNYESKSWLFSRGKQLPGILAGLHRYSTQGDHKTNVQAEHLIQAQEAAKDKIAGKESHDGFMQWVKDRTKFMRKEIPGSVPSQAMSRVAKQLGKQPR